MQLFAVDAAAAQADHIEADQIGERSMRHAERDDVGAHAAQPDDHRALADAHELAHRGRPPNTTWSPTLTWPPSRTLLAKMTSIADLAVMRDVGAGHQEAVIADLGDAAIVLGADVHR